MESYLTTYTEKQREIQENNPGTGRDQTLEPQASVKEVLVEVAVFSLASHLLWTLWSLKQAQYSNIPFAYYSFARDRMEDYRMKKQQLARADLSELPLLSSL